MGDQFRQRLRQSLEAYRGAEDADVAGAREDVLNVLLEGGLAPAGAPQIIRKAIEVPVFTGDLAKDKQTANEFMARAIEAKDVGRLGDDEMIRYLKLRLQGKAWTWVANGIAAAETWTTDWAQFQTEFLRRWADSATISEKVLLRKSLYQKSTEGVQDFYDRVLHVENVLQRDNPNRAAAGFRDMYNANCLFNFLSGLKPEIHEKVVSIGCDTLTIARDNAVKAEKALFDTRKKKDGLVAAIEQIEESARNNLEEDKFEVLQQTLAALKIYQKGDQRGRGGRGGRGQRGRGRGRGQFRTTQGSNYQFKGKCFHCEEIGHMEAQCPSKNKKQEAFAVENDLNAVAPAWTTVTRQ